MLESKKISFILIDEARVAPEKLALLQPASSFYTRATMKEVVMKFIPLPTQERLKELFTYEPATGRLISRVNRYSWRIGHRVGHETPHGYRAVGVDGSRFFEHRIIYKLVYGNTPHVIDHINRDRGDNRLCNLRAVEPMVNTWNRTQARSFVKPDKWGKYNVELGIGGTDVYLGAYACPALAEMTVMTAQSVRMRMIDSPVEAIIKEVRSIRPVESYKHRRASKRKIPGVYKEKGKYRSRINIDGKRINLGSFDCPLVAAVVYEYANANREDVNQASAYAIVRRMK